MYTFELSDTKMDVYRLHVDELDYELLIRNLRITGNAQDKRKTLRTHLSMERMSKTSFMVTSLDAQQEIDICEDKLVSLETQVDRSDSPISDNDHKRLLSRLLHVHGRIERINVDSETLFRCKESLRRRTSETLSELESKLLTPSLDVNLIDLQEEGQRKPVGKNIDALLPSIIQPTPVKVEEEKPVNCITPALDRVISSPSIITRAATPPSYQPFSAVPQQRPSLFGTNHNMYSNSSSANFLAINKWRVTFDGGPGLSSFLEQIEEMRIARNVTPQQLFEAAVELFTGNARIWYRTIRNSISSWEGLVTALRTAFLPCDYEINLWDEIRNRTQGDNEPVVIYLAIMENLFSRLSRIPVELERVGFVRRNLQPYLQAQLALQDVQSMAHLGQLCKMLEDARTRASKFKNPPTPIQSLEPDLAYRRNRVEARAASIETRPLDESATKLLPDLSTVNMPSRPFGACWNCNQTGHLAIRCPLPRQLKCFRCGKPDVTVRNCPVCSGNGAQGR